MFRRKYRKVYHISVPIEKEGDDGKPIVYKLKFTDSFRFTSTSLSSLVDSLSDGVHNISVNICSKYKCKYKCNFNSFLDYMNFYDDKLLYRCFECKINYNKILIMN